MPVIWVQTLNNTDMETRTEKIMREAVEGLIAVIKESLLKNGGHVRIKSVSNGTARCHNESWELKITDVYDYAHSDRDAMDKSDSDIYFKESGCCDAPIEELDVKALSLVASQCETNPSNKL